MADPINIDPKDIKLIEDYLKAAGLKGQELLDRMEKIKTVASEFNRELKNAKEFAASIDNEFTDLSATFKNVISDLGKSNDLSSRINKSFKSLGGFADQLKYDMQDISNLNQKDLESIEKKIKTRVSDLIDQRKELGIRFKGKELDEVKNIALDKSNKELAQQASQYLELQSLINENGELIIDENVDLDKQSNYLVKILGLTQKRINQEKNLSKSIGATGIALKGAETIASKLGLSGLDEVFGKAKKAAEEKAKALGVSETHALGISGQLKTMGAAAKSLGSSMLKALKDPLVLITAQIAIIKKFYDLYGGVNQRITDQGKQLGISYQQSEAIYKKSVEYAASQRNAFITGERLTEGRQKLNEALGTSINFTDKEAGAAERLSHYYGISAEQNGRLVELGRELGTTNDDILKTVLNTAAQQKAQIGGTIQYQKVVQKVSSVSGEILTKFKGNVAELAKAVVQADRLGLTLEQVDKIGESLLNFETSIENELKAELLTGKAINLEKARAAALSGDTVKLTNEIAKQVGNIHQFEKMNTIQRKAYAEAFGMTASEMGDMLRKREFENKMAASGAKTAQEQLDYARKNNIAMSEKIEKDLEAKSLAELQKYTFEKIKEILVKITSGPMQKLYNFLTGSLKTVEKIFGYFSSMSGGPLGNALAAVLLGGPLLIGAIRGITALFTLGVKGLLIPKPTGRPMDPVFIAQTMGAGGKGGAIGGPAAMASPSFFGTGGKSSGLGGQGFAKDYRAYREMGGSRFGAIKTATQYNKWGMGANLALGGGLAIGGMAANAVAANMEEGGAKQAVGVLGQTAQYAGMGAIFGPWGAAIGGLVGLGMGLFSLSKENEERRKQETEASKAQQDQTNALLEQLAIRPIQLNVNNEGINRLNTNTSMATANGALGR